MKAKPLILTVSLGAILVVLWMLLWGPPTALAPETKSSASTPTVDEILPLPTASGPLIAPALLPPPEEPWSGPDSPPATSPQAAPLSSDGEKPYAPAPPPNPHAAPPWPERLPHRETQAHRTLLTEPKR